MAAKLKLYAQVCRHQLGKFIGYLSQIIDVVVLKLMVKGAHPQYFFCFRFCSSYSSLFVLVLKAYTLGTKTVSGLNKRIFMLLMTMF